MAERFSGIVDIACQALRWRDAPSAYDPHRTLFYRWKRWGEGGVLTWMTEELERPVRSQGR